MSTSLRVFGVALIIASAFFASGSTVYAVGTAADAQCVPWYPQCSCGAIPTAAGCVQTGNPKANTNGCPVGVCTDTTNGKQTKGICVALNKCQGVTSAEGGSLGSGLSSLGSILGQVLGKLMNGQSSGSGSGSGSGAGSSLPSYPTTQTGCTTGYFQTSDITQLSNPCAQYVAPAVDMTATGTSNTCDALSQALGMCGTSADVTITNNNINTNTNDNTNAAPTTQLTSVTGASTTASTTPNLGTPSVLGPAGQAGGIVFLNNGATIYGTFQNLPNNTTIAGFYGGSTFSGQSQGIAAQICQARPWANNFVAALIPPSFFDNLCTSRGYQVGTPTTTPAVVAPSVQLQQTTPTVTSNPTPTPKPTTSVDTGVQAQVHIWAVPASVPLGTRTLIYWSTQGVTDCAETSPDGNFTQNLLSGGAATVPLTGPTTFTISCTDAQGNPITDYVTVQIAN